MLLGLWLFGDIILGLLVRPLRSGAVAFQKITEADWK